MKQELTALECHLGAYWALAYDEGRTQTSQGTEANEKLCAIKALFKAKDAEIAALTTQLASLARGVKISIPTDTMEQECQQHYKRGAASRAVEIAALRSANAELIAVLVDIEVRCPAHSAFYTQASVGDTARLALAKHMAMAQAVQP